MSIFKLVNAQRKFKRTCQENKTKRPGEVENTPESIITTYTFASSFVAYVTLTTAVSDSVFTKEQKQNKYICVATNWENFRKVYFKYYEDKHFCRTLYKVNSN